ncbi:putative bifunctional diguanylate cyclase/phosphodiesterase [Castellaniella hirudinis]|uniref:putative bifunctional diguanylate cyclase/phosphodiesterase n=1 Tax=Castellaniella hirudinis TaxID=1144617 RepID=UPI0039C48B19
MVAEREDDAFTFMEETANPDTLSPAHAWQILLVDDEPDVHAATTLALKNTEIEGRPLAFSHAYSAQQALALLRQRDDFSVALVDVVMGRNDEGLQLVREIREDLANPAIRIILRTGQPGYAPEIDTIRLYDINDYKTKSELTQVRLFTSLTMAVRSYAQIRQLESSRRGLEQILAATTQLSKPAGLKKFASGLATQLCALLQVKEECLVCASMPEPGTPSYVLAAAGCYDNWIGMALQDIPDQRVKSHLLQALDTQRHHFSDGVSLYFPGKGTQALAAFVDIPGSLQDLERGLLEVFCSNLAVAFENLQLYLDINDLAYLDALVNLPNRNALVAAIDRRLPGKDAVALLDLDNFADINSILDDSYGDAVLQMAAQRLRNSFPADTMVARLGSDLFGLYGPASQLTPQRIAQVFATPIEMPAGEPLRLSATAGLVQLHHDPQPGVAILKNAGAALKQAKRFQRGKAMVFEATQADAARDRIQLLNRLRASFSEERLFLNFQPFVNLHDGRVVGAECLLRWKTPDGQFIPPDRFIPLAEQSGLMIPIGEWVFSTALKWRKSLGHLVEPDFRVAVNVSHVQFAEPEFVLRFLGILDAVGVPGAQVEIELTESVAIGNINRLASRLDALRARGISVAMDDFGTGYSSLSVIQRLRLDRLKIDRSFVSGDQGPDDSFDIARTVIALARHLQVATIAEGIETEAQRLALLAAGCDEGQGYLFSRPLDAEAFRQWLIQQAADSR